MLPVAITDCRKIEDYKNAISHAGGEGRVVHASDGVAAALDGIGGLLLTGGDDVAPARYNEEPHPTVVHVAPERDEFEFALVLEARKRGLPILAICRGIQVLNVALGGTLIQDIASQVPGAIDHKFTIPPHQSFELAHEVWVERDSLLASLLRDRLVDGDSCEVNSRHHQAVSKLASGLRVTATAPDGIIEAIEDPAVKFCLGVQWHPENFWRTGEFRALFEGFLAAAG